MNDIYDVHWNAIYIGFYWKDRPLTGQEHITRALDYIDEVAKLLPVPRRINLVDKEGESMAPLPVERAAAEAALIGALRDDVVYLNDDRTVRSFRRSSKCLLGFANEFILAYGDPEAHVTVRPHVGQIGSDAPDVVSIDFFDRMTAPHLLQTVFKSGIEFWKPEYGYAQRRSVRAIVGRPPGMTGVGWLTFLAGHDLDVPSQIRRERFAGGEIYQTSPDVPDVGDEAAIQAIRDLKDVLERRRPLAKTR
jgi:hypothetical protein